MKINDILHEGLFYNDHPCSDDDCGACHAGYQYAMTHDINTPCNTSNGDFNYGCNLALKQIKSNKISKPRIRDDEGEFADSPEYKRMRKHGRKP